MMAVLLEQDVVKRRDVNVCLWPITYTGESIGKCPLEIAPYPISLIGTNIAVQITCQFPMSAFHESVCDV